MNISFGFDLKSIVGLVLLVFLLMTIFGRELRPLGAISSLILSGAALIVLFPVWEVVLSILLLMGIAWFVGGLLFALVVNEPVPYNEYYPCPLVFIPFWPVWICLVSLVTFKRSLEKKSVAGGEVP